MALEVFEGVAVRQVCSGSELTVNVVQYLLRSRSVGNRAGAQISDHRRAEIRFEVVETGPPCWYAMEGREMCATPS